MANPNCPHVPAICNTGCGGAPDCSCFEDLSAAICECLENLTVDIGNIDIEELDVTASGLTSVTRCTVDCEPIDILFCKDENHAGGQGVDTDDGVFALEVLGWVDSAGVFTPGAPTVPLQSCSECPEASNETKTFERCVVAIGNSVGGGYVDGDQGSVVNCVQIAPDGTATTVSEFLWINGTALQIPAFEFEDLRDCPSVCTPETFCVEVWENFVDNHFNGERPPHPVAYPQDNHQVVYTCSDGTTFTLDLPATGAGTGGQWNIAHAAALAALTGKPWVRGTAPFDGDPNTPYGAYASVECCAGDKVIVSAVATTVGGSRDGRTFNLLTGTRVLSSAQVTKCTCCGEAPIWRDATGAVIPEPACITNCEKCPLPVTPPLVCNPGIIGPFCDIVLQEDADGVPLDPTPADIVQSDVFLEVISCADGTQSINAFLLPGDPAEPEPYDVQGYLGDCDTLELFDPPTPECPDDCQFIPVEWTLHHAGQDNNGVPWIPMESDESATIRVTLADGTVADVGVPATTGWTEQIDSWVTAYSAVFPDCTWTARCRDPNTGGACGTVPGAIPGPSPDADLPGMYYRYLAQECCDAGRLIVSAEIVACSNPARIGGLFNVEQASSGCIRGFQCVTCDGVKLYDADMNLVPVASLPVCVGNCLDPLLAKPTSSGICRCYGETTGGSEPVEYVNDDNNTDIDASQNATGIKWNLQPGQEPDADAFTAAIEACINSGEVAHISWTDTGGNVSLFDADTIVTPASAGQAFYTGTAGSPSFAGKLSAATVACGDGAASGSTACLWTWCDAAGTEQSEWRDSVTGEALTDEQLATLRECEAGNTHLIEGCIEVAGEKVSAFTIVDDLGNPQFTPKPLTDLGFVECC